MIQLVPEGSRRGARVAQGTVRMRVEPGESATVYGGWLVPFGGSPVPIDEATYDAARAAAGRLLARSGSASSRRTTSPSSVVMDAQRSLLIQDLALTWRYSVGNQYEEFSFAEALDTAEVMAEYGFPGVDAADPASSLARLGGGTIELADGREADRQRALYVRLSGDREYLDQATPMRIGGSSTVLGRQIRSGHGGLLRRERYSSDIAARVYGLHAQAAVWQGLNAIADVWRASGHTAHARKRARARASRCGPRLHRAVAPLRAPAEGRLAVRPGRAARPATSRSTRSRASRPGSYWNLVVPYALASGFFTPRRPAGERDPRLHARATARGCSGSCAPARTRCTAKPRYPVSGTDQVYGLNVARFLADNDRPDQLVLSLYGMLGASMTPEHVRLRRGGDGRAAAAGRRTARCTCRRTRPSNSAFLETLRLMLVHETRRPGRARRSASSSPSRRRGGWLAAGKSIAVRESPTSFGPLSYEIDAGFGQITATVDVPERRPPLTMKLRLRVPAGHRVIGVRVDGKRRPFDRETATVDLSGLRGTLSIVAAVR